MFAKIVLIAALTAVPLSATAQTPPAAQAQAAPAQPAQAQPTPAAASDRDARIKALVDGACGAGPAQTASATDHRLHNECRATATSRAEAMVR